MTRIDIVKWEATTEAARANQRSTAAPTHRRMRPRAQALRRALELALGAAFLAVAPEAFASPQVKSIHTSSGRVCAVFDDGRIKCWGQNGAGQLGLGDTNPRGDEPNEMGDALPFVDLGTGARVTQLALGPIHSCALLADGGVKCWGNNDSGELGLGDTTSRGDQPNQMGDALPRVDLGTGAKARALAAGNYHTCALLADGRVKCWGYNDEYGALGLGDTAIRGDGPKQMGDALPAVDLGKGQKAIAISAAGKTTCAVLTDRSLKCWGVRHGLGDENARGDTPNEMGDALPAIDLGPGAKVESVAVGHLATCALLTDRSVKCWGMGAILGNYSPINSKIGSSPGQMGAALRPVAAAPGTRVRSIAMGEFHACATLEGGGSDCWGDNTKGVLGWCDLNCDASTGQFLSGSGSGMCRLGDRSCYPIRDRIELNGQPWQLKNTSRIDLGGNTTVVAMAVGDLFAIQGIAGEEGPRAPYSCALGSDGAVRCWGVNEGGVLGRGTDAAPSKLMGYYLPETCLIDADCARREEARKKAHQAYLNAPGPTPSRAPSRPGPATLEGRVACLRSKCTPCTTAAAMAKWGSVDACLEHFTSCATSCGCSGSGAVNSVEDYCR